MTALERAIAAAGSQSELARRIGKKQAHVWTWLHRKAGVVPAEIAAKIERAVDGQVTRAELRPDLFDAPAEPARESAS